MSFLSKIGSGSLNVFGGAIGFAADSLRSTRALGKGDFGSAAEILVESVQEDLMEGVMGGLMGAEGIGGALIGALPEAVRAPSREVINPVFEGWNWVIQETVDRPLGTIASVVSAGIKGGPETFFEADTYARAWEINDKRTFGQSVVAAIMRIDPFDEEEYNSIQDDPLFNLFSGVLDFGQEFLDPIALVGGGALKMSRGQLVTTRYGRTFSSSKRVLTPKGSLTPKTVIGGGAGIRPETLFKKSRGILTKSAKQVKASDAVKQTYLSKRVESIIGSSKWKALDDKIDKAQVAKGASRLDESEKFAIIRDHLGATGRSLSDEAVTMLASSDNAVARANTLRFLSSDFRVMEKWREAATLIQAELVAQQARTPFKFGKKDSTGQILGRSNNPLVADALNDFDWALFDVFDSALESSQRQRYVWDRRSGSYWESSASTARRLGQTDAHTALLALDKLLGNTNNPYYFKAQAGGSRRGVSITEMPAGTRFQELFRDHIETARANGSTSYSQHVNHNTVGGRSRVIRTVTEYMSHTHIFLNGSDAVEQYRRALTKALRVEGIERGVGADSRLWVEEQVGKFSRHHMSKDVAAMESLWKGTVGDIVNEISEVHKDLDPYARSLADTMKGADEDWVHAVDQFVGLTNEAGVVDASVSLAKNSPEEALFVLFAMSPSQAKASFVIPRFDNIQRSIELARKSRLDKAVRSTGRAISEKGRVPHQIWRSSVLLTPKWPMRVAIDEQLRIASHLGATTMMANFANGFEQMRRAHAVHKLDGWGDVGKIEKLVDEMQKRTPGPKGERLTVFEKDAIDAELKAQTAGGVRVSNLAPDVAARRKVLLAQKADDRALVAAAIDEDDFVGMWESAGREGYDASVGVVQKELVNAGRNQRKLIRNAGIKGAIGGALLANPVMGASFGMVAWMSKRRRIRAAAAQKSAMSWASATRQQGRELFAEALSASDRNAARQMMSDADKIDELIANNVGKDPKKIKSAFDIADELMEEAGVPSLQIGGATFRNSFGDDISFQEQIRAQASANQSMGAIYSGARDQAERELAKFASVERVVHDYLEKGGDFETAYSSMVDLYTTNTDKVGFYEAVWGEGTKAERVNAVYNMLYADKDGFRNLMLKRTARSRSDTGNIGYDELHPDDLREIAKSIVDEYDNVLPAEYFPATRAKARAGGFTWGDVKREMSRNEQLQRETIGHYAGRGIAKEPTEQQVIDYIRLKNQKFGKAHAPETVATAGDQGFLAWVKEKADGAYSMLGELPSDNLARHPFFSSVYDREIYRATADLMDDQGRIHISQNAIDNIEAHAREVALTETKSLLYELSNGTRLSEYMANISPFFNAWQEVIGRWAGIAVESPFFVGNAMRLYKKPWEAETLGLSEVTNDDGSTFFVFRLFGEGYDEAGAPTTIFDAIPESVREWIIPEAIRDTDVPLRFSKDGLNTVLQGSPGVGPFVTIPMRELVLGTPELEDAVSFLFPFGHPKGGFIERLVQANAPAYAKHAQSLFMDTHTSEALNTRLFRDMMVRQSANGTPFDYSDEEAWNEMAAESERQTAAVLMLRVAGSAFLPTAMSVMSPYQELVDEYRALLEEHGNRLGEAMFLDAHGEEFFALTGAMSQLNDGVSSSVEAETLFISNQDLVQAHPVLGALVTRSLGSKSGAYAYSSAVNSRQFHMTLNAGTEETRRQLKTGREVMETSDEHIGWMKYTEFMDWVKGKQEEAEMAGLSSSLNAKHMRSVAAVKTRFVDDLKKEHPAWATQFDDIFRSERHRIEVNDGMIAYLRDPVMLARDETKHIIEYYKLRMYVQTKLEERFEAGGSRKLEGTNSNEDLLMFWRDKSDALGRIPNFSSIWDRYFERDNIAINTFIDHDAFAEGLFLSV